MSDLDLTRLLQGHVVLSALAAFSNAPAWNVPLAVVGLVVVPQLGEGHGAESVRQFVLALGGSLFLDFIWFVQNSTHGLVRVLILLNWLLKIVTVTTALSSLRARGEGSFSFPGAGAGGMGGFSLPGGLADRLPGGFPPFGQQRQQHEGETVWAAPPQQPASYQTRFSLDEEASAGSATPPPPPPPTSGSGKSGAAAGRKGAQAGTEPHLAAEGGGYHSLE
ncbi:hypothetical protein JCM10449v2_000606 [Rhodotorula kratochvilovae]